MSRLLIRHGVVRRAGRPVLEPGLIDVAVPAAVAVVGVNGSGKSSLLLNVAGALYHQRPAPLVTLDGRRPAIGLVPQTPALPPWLTVEAAARLYGLSFPSMAERAPGLFLDELRGSRCGALSLGQLQALAVAVALHGDFELLVLDEPFSALDFRRRIAALQLLAGWRDAAPGRALIVSSQNAADLVTLCNHFVVLRAGRQAFSGGLDGLGTNGGSAPTLEVLERRLLELLT